MKCSIVHKFCSDHWNEINNINVWDFDFNATDKKGNTMFHQACFEGNAKAVKVMTEMSKDGYININATNMKGLTPADCYQYGNIK